MFSSVDINKKVFLWIYNNPGATTQQVCQAVRRFMPKLDDEKANKKTISTLRNLEKRLIIYTYDSLTWDRVNVNHWFPAEGDEMVKYLEKVGINE